MEKTFIEECPPPYFTQSPEDALTKCIAFANYHVKTNVNYPATFIDRVYTLYRTEVLRHNELDALTKFASNQTGKLPFVYPKPLTRRQFVATLDRKVQEDYKLYKERLKPWLMM